MRLVFYDAVFVVRVDFRLAGQDDVTVLGERLEFVLARVDTDRGDPVDLAGDGVGDVLAVGDAARQDDDIDLAVFPDGNVATSGHK